MNDNPWDNGAFTLQITAIILAPTAICVSIYLTLKHITLHLEPSVSRIPPKWYPMIFLPADVTCLVVQAVGGGIAAGADADDMDAVESGNNAIIAGIVLQVVVLGVFGVLAVDYWVRVRRYMASPGADPVGLSLWRSPNFRKFGYGMLGAYVSIFIRCVYRIAEMAGGWGNHIMQDEASFMVLDAGLITVTCYLLTIFHPGIFFPEMANGSRRGVNEKSSANSSGTGTERSSMTQEA